MEIQTTTTISSEPLLSWEEQINRPAAFTEWEGSDWFKIWLQNAKRDYHGKLPQDFNCGVG